ncbi:MAG: YciI family protein [Steroidobacteraceae bacterium]
MKVMVLVKATAESEAGVLPTPELFAAMERFNDALVKAGILLAGEGLKPSRQGKRVRFAGTGRTVTDGPFAETKELVAGFWLWQVRSIEEAVEWVKRCPNPMLSDSDIEIRPLYEAEDFAGVMTEEQRAHEAGLRRQVARQTN